MGAVCSNNREEDTADPAAQPQPAEKKQQQQEAGGSEQKANNSNKPADATVDNNNDDDDDDKEIEAEEDEDDSDLEDFDDVRRKVNPATLLNADELDAEDGFAVRSAQELEGDDLFATEETDGKVSYMAVKPWKGSIVAPSDAPDNDASAPEAKAELEWVYGYRCHDSRANVAVVDGAVIYPSAAVAVRYVPGEHSQTHFRGMTDDITCLAQNPADKNVVALGQKATIVDRRAMRPHICVWNSATQESWTLPKAHKRAVRCVGFSTDGKYLASVGHDNAFTLSVWDWEAGKRLASLSADAPPHKIFQLVWSSESEFVTVGSKHVYFWTFDAEAGTLKKGRGLLRGGNYKLQSFFSLSFTRKGFAAVGTKDGNVYFFNKNKAGKAVKLHDGAVFANTAWAGGLITGGKDGKVVVIDSQLNEVRKIDVGSAVRSLAVDGPRLVIGTRDGRLVEAPNFAESDETKELVAGHFDGELWSLAVHPTNNDLFATAGEDNRVFIWDAEKRAVVSHSVISTEKGKKRRRTRASSSTSEAPNRCARSAAFSPAGDVLVVGTNQGSVGVFRVGEGGASLDFDRAVDLNKHGKSKVTNKTEQWIETIAYSPDGKLVAVGTHGSVIVLLDAESFDVKSVLKAHNAAITALDWSADSKHIRSNCRAYELLFFDVDTDVPGDAKQNPDASALKDVEWASATCPLTWETQGVFAPDQDGTDVNVTAKCPTAPLLASGDDYGNVNLYRYPCAEQGNEHIVLKGHASHVMNVRFANDGKRMWTVGGEDKTILQWRL
eukprot:TRINITY_DN66802_c4_g1_i1.p1 TRINITY_DN66802_c4_g1~~TRINITY_DN66802_c4_g1_i1.p1  ORF type:complete len:807 (-),score=500.45 TRINITY_DN66802_c4_g1_i1:110-2446(-)